MRYFWIIFNLIVTAIFIATLTETIKSQTESFDRKAEFDNRAVVTPVRPETDTFKTMQTPRSEEEIAAIEEELTTAAETAAALKSVKIFNEWGKELDEDEAAIYLLPETEPYYPNFRVREPIRPASLLRTGEAFPNDDLLELFLEFRTRPIAETRCDLLPADLATRCAYERHQPRYREREKDLSNLSITTDMKMINANPDPLPEGDMLLVIEGKATLESAPFLWNEFTDFAAHIRALLSRHNEVCAIVREANGNCRVVGIEVGFKTDDRHADSSVLWLNASSSIYADVRYAYFQPVELSN